MQLPTCSDTFVKTTDDAKKIFEAVYRQILPIMPQRLSTEERRRISSGQVFVWEERSSGYGQSSSSGIERWTDSITWGPSRVKEEFLYYHEKERPDGPVNVGESRPSAVIFRTINFPGTAPRNLVKQTYSVIVQFPDRPRKWHLTAYYTEDTIPQLHTVDNHPAYPFLADMNYPPTRYRSARGRRPSEPIISPPPSGGFPMDYLPIKPRKEQTVPMVRSSPEPWSLAPLEYLKRVAPQSRHPVDEEAIMSFPIYDYLACAL